MMKKIFMFILAIMVGGVFASTSFAFTIIGSDGSGGEITLGATDTVTVKLSANVKARYGYIVAAGDDYAASAYNGKGKGRVFAIGSAAGTIYYKPGVNALENPPNFTEGTTTYSGWSTF